MKSVTMLVLLAACAPDSRQTEEQISPTVYYKPVFGDDDQKCSSQARVPMVDKNDHELVQVCPEILKACLMQGSCVVQTRDDWTSYNYHSRKNGSSRFMIVDRKKCPFGYGVKSVCLDPYFSVAADLEFYSPGDVLFVPKLVGVQLPTGEIHDGYVIVRDRGGSIKGADRIDFFIGYSEPDRSKEVFTLMGLGDKTKRLAFRKGSIEETDLIQKARHYPGVKPELLEKIPF